MSWKVEYHAKVRDDLRAIGKASARRIQKAIHDKLIIDPVAYGKPLSRELHGYMKLRVGDMRIVFKIEAKRIVVFVITIGMRANEEVYREAMKRRSS